MRKIDPADVRGGFSNEASELLAYFERIRPNLAGDPHEKADTSQLASMVFLDLYVGFERFLSDLFLAYLNRDFSLYQQDLDGRIQQSVESRFSPWAAERISFDPVDHVKVDELESIIDSDGWNLTFKNADAIVKKATDWLVPAYATRITSLTSADMRLIDTARAVRDFIAHQSKGAKRRMNEKLESISHGGGNKGLSRGTQNINVVGETLRRRSMASAVSEFMQTA